jgi:uncharacterized membrane protein YtjA (UPF0391 family)
VSHKVVSQQSTTLQIWEEVTHMLRWALILLVIALIAAALGFGGIAGAAANIAQILFWVFIVLFVLALIFGRDLDF